MQFRLALLVTTVIAIVVAVQPPGRNETAQINIVATTPKAKLASDHKPQEALKPVEVKPPAIGSKEDWMQQAGIQPGDYANVDFIISHESGWDPCSYNPSQSDCNAQPTSACGLPQALPCSKLGSDWNNPVTALKWADSYARARYGSWSQAVAFWQANSWW